MTYVKCLCQLTIVRLEPASSWCHQSIALDPYWTGYRGAERYPLWSGCPILTSSWEVEWKIRHTIWNEVGIFSHQVSVGSTCVLNSLICGLWCEWPENLVNVCVGVLMGGRRNLRGRKRWIFGRDESEEWERVASRIFFFTHGLFYADRQMKHPGVWWMR